MDLTLVVTSLPPAPSVEAPAQGRAAHFGDSEELNSERMSTGTSLLHIELAVPILSFSFFQNALFPSPQPAWLEASYLTLPWSFHSS